MTKPRVNFFEFYLSFVLQVFQIVISHHQVGGKIGNQQDVSNVNIRSSDPRQDPWGTRDGTLVYENKKLLTSLLNMNYISILISDILDFALVECIPNRKNFGHSW